MPGKLCDGGGIRRRPPRHYHGKKRWSCLKSPNKITLVLLTCVIMWPKRANGTSPKVSTLATFCEAAAVLLGAVLPCPPPPNCEPLELPEKDEVILY